MSVLEELCIQNKTYVNASSLLGLRERPCLSSLSDLPLLQLLNAEPHRVSQAPLITHRCVYMYALAPTHTCTHTEHEQRYLILPEDSLSLCANSAHG